MAIDRDEFDRLVARVDRLELGQHATIELVASEIVGLRTTMEERFAAMDRTIDVRMGRFEIKLDGFEGRVGGLEGRMDRLDGRMDKLEGRMDRVEEKLDRYTEQVGVAIRVGSEAVAENRRQNAAILRKNDLVFRSFAVLGEHLGVEMPEA